MFLMYFENKNQPNKQKQVGFQFQVGVEGEISYISWVSNFSTNKKGKEIQVSFPNGRACKGLISITPDRGYEYLFPPLQKATCHLPWI